MFPEEIYDMGHCGVLTWCKKAHGEESLVYYVFIGIGLIGHCFREDAIASFGHLSDKFGYLTLKSDSNPVLLQIRL
jgi:hypothetical protein